MLSESQERASAAPTVRLRLHPSLSIDPQTVTAIFGDIAGANPAIESTVDRDFLANATQARMAAMKESVEYLLKTVLKDKPIIMPKEVEQRLQGRRANVTQLGQFIQHRYAEAIGALNNDRINAMSPALAHGAREKILTQFTQDCVGLLVHSYGLEMSAAVQLMERAEQFGLLQQTRDKQITVVPVPDKESGQYMKDTFFVMVDTPQQAVTRAMADEYLRYITDGTAPRWLSALNGDEKQMLQHELSGVTSIEDVQQRLVNVSSKLRIIPILPNAYVHESFIYTKGQLIPINIEGRSSMVSSRDLFSVKADERTRREHALHNLELNVEHQLAEGVQRFLSSRNQPITDGMTVDEFPILFQTMISPYLTEAKDSDLHKYKEEAIQMFQRKFRNGIPITIDDKGESKTITVKPRLFSTNHPINYYTLAHGLGGEKQDTKELLDYARSQLSHLNPAEKADVIQLIHHIETDMARNYNFGKKANQSLMLNTHEQLLIQKLGGFSFGSCVSGKDRKQTEIMHTNASILYRMIYGVYPGFHKDSTEQRDHFLRIYAELFCSRHHQKLSAENALGSEGIKNIGLYLGKDHEQAVQRRFEALMGDAFGEIKSFQVDDRLAGRNDIIKISRISKDKLKPADIARGYEDFATRVFLAAKDHAHDGMPIDIVKALRQMVDASVAQNTGWISKAPEQMRTVQAMLRACDVEHATDQAKALNYKVLSQVEQYVIQQLLHGYMESDSGRDFCFKVLSYCENALDGIAQQVDNIQQLMQEVEHVLPPSVLSRDYHASLRVAEPQLSADFAQAHREPSSESTSDLVDGFVVLKM